MNKNIFLFMNLLSVTGVMFGTTRFNDFGNFKNVTYDKLPKDTLKDINSDDDLVNFVTTNRLFDGCMRGMQFIKSIKKFLIGPAQRNVFDGISVDIGGYFIDKTPITVKEYKKFIDILNNYLEKKKNGDMFTIAPTELEDKYLKYDDNKIDERFKVHYDWFLELRKELQNKLSKEYIEDLQPDLSVFNNDDFAKRYLTDSKYEDYPIVGVYFNQLQEYCKWRTLYLNEYYIQHAKRKNRCFIKFSIPTYPQYCYAASCGSDTLLYPWGTINLRDKKNRLKANFNIGQYKNGDIGLTNVKKHQPNAWGLYDMAGNVNEWLDDNEYKYLPSTYDNKQEIKMTTGGSWMSYPAEIEIGKYRNVHVLETKQDLGFRCVAEVII